MFLKPTILVISYSDINKDVRLQRHIRALKQDYRVMTISYGKPHDVVDLHIEIPAKNGYLPVSLKPLLFLVARKYKYVNFHIPANRWVLNQIKNLDYEYVMLIDVEVLPLIDHLNPNSKILVDMYEYAPREMEDDWRFRVLLMRYHTWLCRKYLPSAYAVTTVSKSLAEEYESQFYLEKVEVLYNARELQTMSVVETIRTPIKLIHTGLAAKSRKLEVMINAVGKMNGFNLDLFLMPAPRQMRTLKKLRQISQQYTNVRVLEPIISSQLPELIHEYDLGLVFIYPSNFSLQHAMPNKLFDCLQARVGVVVGPSPDMQRVVTDWKIGAVTRSFSEADLQSTLLGLSMTEINDFKANADRIATAVNAETEGKKLLEVLSNL